MKTRVDTDKAAHDLERRLWALPCRRRSVPAKVRKLEIYSEIKGKQNRNEEIGYITYRIATSDEGTTLSNAKTINNLKTISTIHLKNGEPSTTLQKLQKCPRWETSKLQKHISVTNFFLLLSFFYMCISVQCRPVSQANKNWMLAKRAYKKYWCRISILFLSIYEFHVMLICKPCKNILNYKTQKKLKKNAEPYKTTKTVEYQTTNNKNNREQNKQQ